MMTGRSLFAAAIAVALFAIGAGSSAAAEQKLRVGKAVPNAFTFVPLDVGVDAGIFKHHGLDIEAYGFGGSAKLQQGMASNSIDIGIGSGPELSFVAKGAPVLGVAAMAGKPALLCVVVAQNGPVKTVADLKGKIVSSSTTGSLTTWLVRELSRQQGWGPDGIKLAFLGEEGPQVAALRTGDVQGVTIQIASGYRLEEEGVAKIIYRFGDIAPHFIIHVIYARKALIADDPDAIRRFLAGWFETIAYMESHKDDVVRIAAPIMGVKPELAARAYDELMPTFSRDGKFDPEALKVLARSYVEMELLPKEPDMQTLITEKFLPSATTH
ncbi:MAG TPA: ABC transporter substrate-binding protein [Stellaceae bacterium]|nr:ABC transporter substrate-binding protein [Stellaceae bacterium]